MTDDAIRIEVVGLDKLLGAINRFPQQIDDYLYQAADQSFKLHILQSKGMGRYPAKQGKGPANPYLTQKQRIFLAIAYKKGEIDIPYRRGQSSGSQKFGTNWYIRRAGPMAAEIGNRSTYGKYLVSDNQSRYMASIGWRKFSDVIKEELRDITKVYQAWVNKCIKDLGL